MPRPAATTLLDPVDLAAAAAVVGAELSAEEEEDISLDLVVVYSSACRADHSYAEEAAGIQVGSYLVVEPGIAVAVVAEFELVEVGRLLRRQSPELPLRRDP